MDLLPDEGLVVVAGQPVPLLLAIGDERLVVIRGQAMALLCSRHRCAPFGSWRFPRTAPYDRGTSLPSVERRMGAAFPDRCPTTEERRRSSAPPRNATPQ